jgi:uncharacterized protein (TIGR02421 family)
MSRQFGAFLVVEIWASEMDREDIPTTQVPPRPSYSIFAPKSADLDGVVESFRQALSRIKVGEHSATVDVVRSARWGPKDFPVVMSQTVARQLNCSTVGIEIPPIYRDPAGVEVFPSVLREIRRGLTRALRLAFYDFTCMKMTQHPSHFHTLGRRAVVKAVWEVDQQMADVADSFDFLLQVTPINARQAWNEFHRSKCERSPAFRYRPLPFDSSLLKRNLYNTPVERIEDPALMDLFRAKQDELDRKITMLTDINTKRFLYGSLQVFGGVDKSIRKLARQLLKRVPSRPHRDSRVRRLNASSFARLAEKEIEYYRKRWPHCEARVLLRDDIAVRLMVSNGCLLIDKHARFTAARVRPLLEHEIGTHVVTYWNGRFQPFKQLYSGLAGYDSLQEGLAVLAEYLVDGLSAYLVDGLSARRLRVLAGRVLAVDDLLHGATFVEVYRRLHHDFEFTERSAFSIATRAYRGGGLTKDVVYLKGLSQVLQYLGEGGELEPLFVGKFAVDHIAIMRELHLRKVLSSPPLQPRYLDNPQVMGKLVRLRQGVTVPQLIEGSDECESGL